MRHSILGIPIDAVTRSEAATVVRGFLLIEAQHRVFTPNPEMIVDAYRDSGFAAVLRRANLAIPDGVGIRVVGRLLGLRIPERISGTDFVDDVCAAAAAEGRSVYLLGGEGERVAERAAEKLAARHSGLKVAGAMTGVPVSWESGSVPRIPEEALAAIRAAAPDALFVAFGHRKQELWIDANLERLPSVRVAMGVGGAFDFIAGDVRRAPTAMRELGLEWLWRLMVQPWRFQRIWKAVVTFPCLALFARNRAKNE